ncbi:hypothetical protein EKO04_000972 [Ascochyta lentis]|uniref:Heterokaryon incompatibility domain-containing protein n=1 Tax=Ascochyta lentis TaxID=205686 RepID=A0A8H7JCH6_9PLEO|nr:hypothetical protein EKO04_000972 [Ascochyta lentis]
MPTGFEKINAPCLQALADHLPYLWVDTCCIDKTSSAELSEAINSMFRWWWYRPARVCYVYLEDFEVSSVPGVTADAAIGSEKAGLGKARYFTRRWTLQELVAPRCMDFYHKNWVCFGTKGSLKSALAHVIGINKAYLSDANTQTSPYLLLDVTVDKGISVFAQHPNQFLAAVDTSSYTSEGESSTISGKGLKIQLPLFKKFKYPSSQPSIAVLNYAAFRGLRMF